MIRYAPNPLVLVDETAMPLSASPRPFVELPRPSPAAAPDCPPVLLRTTSDGSHTLLRPDLDETYHSSEGAIAESSAVFIEAGLKHVLGGLAPAQDNCEKNIRILEIGFGTGLNALLTLQARRLTAGRTAYVAIEPYPLTLELALTINHPRLLGDDAATEGFRAIHAAPWHSVAMLTPTFRLLKVHGRAESVALSGPFDLVYFDAFSPASQPELWSESVFKKVFAAMNDGGVLVTYCAKGEVKRLLKSVGFSLESLPGFGKKREMTRATKPRCSPSF